MAWACARPTCQSRYNAKPTSHVIVTIMSSSTSQCFQSLKHRISMHVVVDGAVQSHRPIWPLRRAWLPRYAPYRLVKPSYLPESVCFKILLTAHSCPALASTPDCLEGGVRRWWRTGSHAVNIAAISLCMVPMQDCKTLAPTTTMLGSKFWLQFRGVGSYPGTESHARYLRAAY